MNNIRNFCIIAHIDHGKSTLADRLLEITQTVEHRRMKAQYLDQLELERERGITIKMAPVRMAYKIQRENGKEKDGETRVQKEYPQPSNFDLFTLNLIDTPGHPDFGYEVSRALAAVEGAILLVDATQGIQAQTLSNFYAAKKAGLFIVGAINKIDAAHPDDAQRIIKDVSQLLDVDESHIHRISGKTGEGVEKLLRDVVEVVPPPKKTLGEASFPDDGVGRALVFDSFYDDHKGIIAAVRVFNGSLHASDVVQFLAVGDKIKIKEVGYLTPLMKQSRSLDEGEIGYIVTGLKDPNKIKIGDTIISKKVKGKGQNEEKWALPGYKEPKPVVFVSFFADNPDEFDDLRRSLERLRLNDSSFVFEPDTNEVLGRGFKGGFLGKLHFEIISQRLEKEFGVKTVTSFPSVAYRVKSSSKKISTLLKQDERGWYLVHNPKDLPEEFDQIEEPMIRLEVVCSVSTMGSVLGLGQIFRWKETATQHFGSERIIIHARMPLAELISDFDDRLKSISGGFASFSYEEDGYQVADLVRLDTLVAGDIIPGLSRVVPRDDVVYEARKITSRLKDTLPRQQFTQAIQAKALGRIIARETIPALRKDVTGYLYGGDRTRKMKLWKKQKEGKKKLLSMASVRIAPEDFKKLLAK